MSTKQEASHVSKHATFESVDDNPSQRGEHLSSRVAVEALSSTAAIGNQMVPPIQATMQKRSRPPSAIEEKVTKKIRSDSFSPALKEDSQSNVNLAINHGEFDLCTPEGQIAAWKAENPDKKTQMTWEQAKHAARREYNRVNAARARQRHKEEAETRDQQIAELKSQVEQLTRLNEVLMNYICGLQAPSNMLSAAHMGTTFNHSLVDAASLDAKKAAANGTPSMSTSTMNAATNSALMSLLKEMEMAENAQAQQNHQNYLNSKASMLQNEKSYSVNERSQNMANATSSVGPMMRALQLQQLLADRGKSNNASLPLNTLNIASSVPSTDPSQGLNSLWDFLLSLQQLHNLLPSSGAPK